MNYKIFSSILTFSFCIFMSSICIAQEEQEELTLAEDGPPQEAPYVQEDGAEERAGSDEEELEIADEPEQELEEDRQVVSRPTVKGRLIDKSYIQHPEASKGLMRIDANKVYYYKPSTYAVKSSSSSFRLGIIETPVIEASSGVTDFDDMYGSEDMNFFMYDYEWQPFTKVGKFGVNLGLGIFSAVGKGRFLNDGEIAQEKYTFYALPINLGLTYRLEFFKRQWLAPYLTAGVNYMVMIETRDDNKVFSGVGTPLFYGGAGGMLNLSVIDRDLGFSLDAEYGIASLWLTGEAKQMISSNKEFDFTGTMISVGIAADY